MASRLMDNLIALKLLYMLVTPFDKTEAFKLGIIDAKGKILRKAQTLKTEQERDAYNYLHRLVFNIKRLINKLPGGESKLKNLVAAFFMVKESWQRKTVHVNEEQFVALVERLEKVTLVEEELMIMKVLAEDGEAAPAVANNTTGVSVKEPVVKKKDIKKYQNLARRSIPQQVV
jgi:hypothetical protein